MPPRHKDTKIHKAKKRKLNLVFLGAFVARKFIFMVDSKLKDEGGTVFTFLPFNHSTIRLLDLPTY